MLVICGELARVRAIEVTIDMRKWQQVGWMLLCLFVAVSVTGCKKTENKQTAEQKLWREGWGKKLKDWQGKVASWQKEVAKMNKDIAKLERQLKKNPPPRRVTTKRPAPRRVVRPAPVRRPVVRTKPTTRPTSQPSSRPAAKVQPRVRPRPRIRLVRRFKRTSFRKRRRLSLPLLRQKRLRFLKRRVAAIKQSIKWYALGKVEMGRLGRLQYQMPRATSIGKDKKRKAGVWETANLARYGLLRDYDWKKGKKLVTAYYLKPFVSLQVEFDAKDRLLDAKLVTCKRAGKGSIRELAVSLGHHYQVVALLHQSPLLDSWSFRSDRAIRVVNALRKHGKAEVIKGMKLYMELAHKHRVCRYRYDLLPERLVTVMRLLFTRRAKSGNWPVLNLGKPDVLPRTDNAFPLFPLALVDDVPVLLINGYVRSGKPVNSLSALLKDVQLNGVLRASDLAPKRLPTQVVEGLVKGKAWKVLMSAGSQDTHVTKSNPVARKIKQDAFIRFHHGLLRTQALYSLTTLLKLNANPKKPVRLNAIQVTKATQWAKWSTAIRNAKPRWDAAKQTWLPGK